MNNRMGVMIAIIFTILHVTTAHKIIERSIENENTPAARIIANSVNSFSADFNGVVFQDKPKENLICSSLSVAMVLMMAAYGADGKTLEVMNKVLHVNNDENVQKNSIQSFISQFNAMKNVQLHLANKIYVKSGLEIKPEFKMITKTTFQSEIENLNFSNSAVACEEINNWCEKQTNSRIKNLFQPNNFDDDTSLVLVNAVYFKGNWARKFDVNETKLMSFYHADNTTKNVPMMHSVGKYRYADFPELGARIIELPYESTDTSNAVSMIIILPKYINGLQTVEKNLHKVNFTHFLMGDQYEVDLFLPKFKIESKIDLKVPLSTLGMEEIFGNNANFTRITSQPPLKVSKIIQKAFIEVNEEGSEAAAVTEFELENRIGQDDVVKQTIFHVDHPFISLIVSQDVILFSAHVIDPNIV
ncbi:hypothetical protein PV328_006836 [Microctonus aethiopoides]|uniref:Serpin domain-containing protein n=1 Tax=Microctonus aethiopoides TaxID=144406 RepID=A0AA39FQD5_9HYME|nr:hypothetical protein PV328_006836 [Microctonus aethiopoides]